MEKIGETRIVKQRRQPGIKARRTDSRGSILAGLIEFGKRFVLVSENSVDGRDVGAVHVAMLRAGLELLQNLFRLGRFTGMRVTDRQLEIRTAKSGSRERLVAFHPILPAPLRDVNVRESDPRRIRNADRS